MATATPVPTRARWNGASSTSSVSGQVGAGVAGQRVARRDGLRRRSAGRARPARARLGHVGDPSRGPRPPCARRSGPCRAVRSPRTEGARPAQVGQHPLGEGLGGPAVAAPASAAPSRNGAAVGTAPASPRVSRRRSAAHARRRRAASPGRPRRAVDRRAAPTSSPGRPRRAAGVAGGRPAVQLVQLADQHDLDAGDQHGLRAQLERQRQQGRRREPVRRGQPAGRPRRCRR